MARQTGFPPDHVSLAAAFLFLLLGAVAGAAEKVVITHYGGGDFVIEDGATVIYIDPLPPNAPNFLRHFKAFRKANDPVPDLVLITHSHNDHCNVPALRELLMLNPELRVIAPLDAHDALDPILPPAQLTTPIPKPGQPEIVSHGEMKIRVYRTLHGWLTDDALPYNLLFPFHHTYVIETKGRRILVSGDSYDYEQAARNFDRMDAVLWHIYKPSDIFDIQAMQPIFHPAALVPYHLNIRYGLSQPDMAALTGRYRFEDANVIYLTPGSNAFVLEEGRAATPETNAVVPALAGRGVRLALQIDRLYRGLQEPHTVQLLAHVHNDGPQAGGGEVGLETPRGWEVTALDSIAFPKLSPGRDFLCRFRVKGPAGLVLDGAAGYRVAGHLDMAGRRQTRELEVGAGTIYTWNVLGPLELADGQGTAEVFSAAGSVDFGKVYSGRNDAPLRWMPCASRDLHTGYIDMAGLFDLRETFAPMPQASNPRYVRTGERAAGLALAYIDSPSARDVQLHAGAPYGLELTLNGEPVFAMPGYDFNFHCDQFQISARLEKGRNTLLAKVVRGQLAELNLSPWMGFCLRITDPDQRPFRDLTFSIE